MDDAVAQNAVQHLTQQIPSATPPELVKASPELVPSVLQCTVSPANGTVLLTVSLPPATGDALRDEHAACCWLRAASVVCARSDVLLLCQRGVFAPDAWAGRLQALQACADAGGRLGERGRGRGRGRGRQPAPPPKGPPPPPVLLLLQGAPPTSAPPAGATHTPHQQHASRRAHAPRTDARLRALLQRITVCRAHDKAAMVHCLPDTSAAAVISALTARTGSTQHDDDDHDDDLGAPSDPSWRSVLHRLQQVLAASPPRQPQLTVDAIAAWLRAERVAWSMALRANPPWGDLGTPAALQAASVLLDDTALLPDTLLGDARQEDDGTAANKAAAETLLVSCFEATRASAKECAEVVQRALRLYEQHLPAGRYRAAAHTHALAAALEDVLRGGGSACQLGELAAQATQQLRTACAAIFAGRAQCEADALTGAPCIAPAGHQGPHSTASALQHAGPSLHALRSVPQPFTLAEANDVQWQGRVAQLPLAPGEAAVQVLTVGAAAGMPSLKHWEGFDCNAATLDTLQLTMLKSAASDPLSMRNFPTLSAAMAPQRTADHAQQAALRAAWPAAGAAAAKPPQDAAGLGQVIVGVGLEYQCWETGARRLVACQEAAAVFKKKGGSSTRAPLAVCVVQDGTSRVVLPGKAIGPVYQLQRVHVVTPRAPLLLQCQVTLQGDPVNNDSATWSTTASSLPQGMHVVLQLPMALPHGEQACCCPGAPGAPRLWLRLDSLLVPAVDDDDDS